MSPFVYASKYIQYFDSVSDKNEGVMLSELLEKPLDGFPTDPLKVKGQQGKIIFELAWPPWAAVPLKYSHPLHFFVSSSAVTFLCWWVRISMQSSIFTMHSLMTELKPDMIPHLNYVLLGTCWPLFWDMTFLMNEDIKAVI